MRFSVIIPSYGSHHTILKCIQALNNQSFKDFEVICVDSSKDEFVKNIIENNSEFTVIHYRNRISAETARNIAVNKSIGEILLFLDPDCIPALTWLTELDQAFKNGSKAVSGPVTCSSSVFINMAAHLAKFWLWLPDKAKKVVNVAPTANFAVSRDYYFEAGGINGNYTTSADTLLCYNLKDLGVTIDFVNEATVEHIHETTFSKLLKERFIRGRGFGLMRTKFKLWKKSYSFIYILVLPLLPFKNLILKLYVVSKSGYFFEYLKALPLHLMLEHAWMYGQAISHFQKIIKNRK